MPRCEKTYSKIIQLVADFYKFINFKMRFYISMAIERLNLSVNMLTTRLYVQSSCYCDIQFVENGIFLNRFEYAYSFHTHLS